MIPSQPKVESRTRFGRIPFDLYALENWDYEASTVNDGEQWKALVKSYLAMPSIERRPYHEKATGLRKKTNGEKHPKLTYENIERVLKPFQTRTERHASELSGSSDPIWVLACYDDALTDKINELMHLGEVGSEHGSSNREMTFCDPKLYDLDGDPDKLRLRLLERMPGLCDKRRSFYRETHGRSNRRDRDTLEGKSKRMEIYVLFIDREAIEQEFVKVMWLDDHGEFLGITKMAPSEPIGMRVRFFEGCDMFEALESYGLDEHDGVPREEDFKVSEEGGEPGENDNLQKEVEGTGSTSRSIRAPEGSAEDHLEDIKKGAAYELGYEAGYAEGLRVGMSRMHDS